MQWSDVTKAPSRRTLRQFAVLCLVVFGGLAALRMWRGQDDLQTRIMAVAAAVIGGGGLVAPAAIRPVFTGWMILAFPIGWTVSRVALGILFFAVFTFVSLVFRMTGRDVLRLRHPHERSYWRPKFSAKSSEEYLRQF